MKASYLKSLTYSLVLHGAVLLFLLFELTHPEKPSRPIDTVVKQKTTIQPSIEAYSVSSEDVEQAMSTILKQRESKAYQNRLAEQRHEQTLKQLKNDASREQARLRKLALKRKKQERSRQMALNKSKRVLSESKARERAIAKRLEDAERALKAKENRLAKLKKAEARLKQQKADEKKKRLALEQKKASEAKAHALKQQHIQTEVNKYKSLILSAISQNWIVPNSADKSLSCKFQIMLSTTGEVLSVSLIKSSGDKRLDRSAQLAIYKASPLPVPREGDVFQLFKILNLTVKPKALETLT